MIEKHDDNRIAEAYQQVNERLADTKLGRMAYDHIPGANKLMQSPTPNYDDAEPTAQAEPAQSPWQKLVANPDAGVAAARKAAERGVLSDKAHWLWLKVADIRVLQQLEALPQANKAHDMIELFSTKGAKRSTAEIYFRPGNQESNFFVNLQVQGKGYRAPQGGRVAGAGLGSDIGAPEIRGAAIEIVNQVASGKLASLDQVLGISDEQSEPYRANQ